MGVIQNEKQESTDYQKQTPAKQAVISVVYMHTIHYSNDATIVFVKCYYCAKMITRLPGLILLHYNDKQLMYSEHYWLLF